ncbi:MAG: hypothetical protein ACM3ZE_18510 [Myxococcales bacterium]
MDLAAVAGPFAHVAEFFYDVQAYQRFLDSGANGSSDDAYLFYEARVRFSPESDDVLFALRDLSVREQGSGASIWHAPTQTNLGLPELDKTTATRILSKIDAATPVLRVQLAAQANARQMDAFLAATFGKVVFAPNTLEQFEGRISGTELVRFVGSPYELRRPYWANMADCRERAVARIFDVTSVEDWLRELRALHIVCLMGESGRSFYRPQSPLGRRDARPGAFYDTPMRSMQAGDITLLLEGPRVSAPMIGGRSYHALLAESVGDPAATAATRQETDELGTDWGSVCVGFAREDTAPAPWFCPPRPLTRRHFERIFAAFRAGSTPNRSPCDASGVDSLADFHWYFVRLHPFRCANQSLSMNLVNALLARSGCAGIPHLLLDQMALRTTRIAYRKLFARAVRHWGVTASSSLGRWKALAQCRQRLDQFVSGLAEVQSQAETTHLLSRDPEGARLALLLD